MLPVKYSTWIKKGQINFIPVEENLDCSRKKVLVNSIDIPILIKLGGQMAGRGGFIIKM